MSFVKAWDVNNILNQLGACHKQIVSAYNDGFTQLSCKKDLLKVKYEIDELLRQTPDFGSHEQSVVDDLEKNRTWNIINEHSTKRHQ